MADSILSVRNLRVTFTTANGPLAAVDDVSLDVQRGRTLAIVGESGSGKSQAMMAAMGLLAANGSASGSVKHAGREILGIAPAELNQIRGNKITMIFQEPMTSLDPLYPVGRQIAEPLIHHGCLRRGDVKSRVPELLRLVQLPHAEHRLRSYPHELSGGQRQRVMIAMALANGPDILIADEPTTALDVTIQAQILKLLVELQGRFHMAIVFITHDLNLVRKLAHDVVVMQAGQIVEQGPVASVFGAPRESYTRMLLAAEPTGSKSPPPAGAPILLDARAIDVAFEGRRRLLSRSRLQIHAVDAVDITLRKGQTIGIVGESGSGKSTLGRALLQLLPAGGRIAFLGRDMASLAPQERRALRRQMQLVFQDPFGSLSPRMTVGEIVSEGLLVHEPDLSTSERDRRACAALAEVQLDPATRGRYPFEFSGGQRQRIAIARAMILKPQLVVLDEPTSALDRSVQKQIIELLRRLQAEHELSYLFISHDLAVVRAMADTVLVMKDGRVVERGPTEQIFAAPRETYTQELIAAALGPVETMLAVTA